MAFNINAQVILSGPKDVKKVRSTIRKQLSGITTDIKIRVDKSASRNLTSLDKKVTQLNANLATLTTNATKAGAALSTLSKSANSINKVSNNLSKNAANVNKALQKTQKQVKATGSEIEAFGKDAALAIRRFSAFTIATGAIFGFARSVQNATREAIAFQRELARITQVTGATGAKLSGLQSTVDDLATSLGLSANRLLEVSRIFAQTGQSIDQVRASITAVARASLAPTFGDIEKTAEGVVAALAQFNLAAGRAESVLGSLNAVSKRFAVESDDLISVIRRAGGVFAASTQQLGAPEERLRELIGIFTAVRSTTRESADTIATGLRTIFTRIQRPETIKFLENYGIQLRATAEDAKRFGIAQGEFVGVFEALSRVSSKIGSFDTLGLAQLVEELGGVRQVGKLIPALREFAKAEEARKVALEGTNSISGDVAIATQTLAVQVEILTERFNLFIRNVAQSDTFQNLARFAISTANSFITLADSLRPILPLLTAIAGIKLTSAVFGFAKGFAGGIRRGGGAGGVGAGLASAATGGRGAAGTSGIAQNNNTSALQANTAAINKLTIALRSPAPIGGRGLFGVRRANGGPIPKFANGGYVNGPSHAQGGVVAELEGGEFVVPKKLASGGKATLKDNTVAALFLQPGDTTNSEFTKRIAKGTQLKKSGNFKDTRLVTGNIETAILDDKPKKFLQSQIQGSVTSAITNSASKIMSDLEFKPFDIDEKSAAKNAASRVDTKSIEGFIFEAFTSAVSGSKLAEAGATFDFPRISADQRDRISKIFDRPIKSKIGDAKRSFTRSAIQNDDSSMANKVLSGIKANILGSSNFNFNDPQQTLPGMGQKTGLKAFKGKGITSGFRKFLSSKKKITASGSELQQLAKEYESGNFASGGMASGVPVSISNGELQVPPEVAKKYARELENLNSGKGISASLASTLLGGGAGLIRGPGTGTSDSIKTSLPEGTFIVNAKDTERLLGKRQNARSGGAISRQGLRRGGGITGGLESFSQLAIVGSVLSSLDFTSLESLQTNALNVALSLGFLNKGIERSTDVQSKFAKGLGAKGSFGGNFALARRGGAGVGKAGLSALGTSAKGLGSALKGALGGPGGLAAALAASFSGPIVDSISSAIVGARSTAGGVSGFTSAQGGATTAQAIGGIKGGVSGAAAGAAIGSLVPVIGTALGAVIGGTAGTINGIVKAKFEQIKFEEFNKLSNEAKELSKSFNELGKDLSSTENIGAAADAIGGIFSGAVGTTSKLNQDTRAGFFGAVGQGEGILERAGLTAKGLAGLLSPFGNPDFEKARGRATERLRADEGGSLLLVL